MDIKYKPTKPKKEKPPKSQKVTLTKNTVNFGATKVVKIEKQRKVKEQKVKAPKQEKAAKISFTPSKAKKASDLNKGGSVLKKSINPLVPLFVVVAIVLTAVLSLTVILPQIERNGQEIDSILISKTPDKIKYLIGEEVNYDGLRVIVTRKNGETFTVRAANCVITGFDSTTEGDKLITVTYESFVTSFYIKVEEPPRVVPAISGIRLETLPKTKYKLGEPLSTSGGILIREYVDGTTAEITLVNSYVSGYGSITKPGEYELTVKYIEQGIVCKTTYKITVTE